MNKKRAKMTLKVFAITFAALASGLFGGYGFRFLEYTVKAQTPTHYAISYHVTADSEDKSQHMEQDEFLGKKANGDMVSVVTSASNARDITFSSLGLTITTNDKNNNVVVYGIGEPYDLPPYGGDDCKNTGFNVWTGETKTILGFKVYKFHTEYQMSKDDEWKAPALGCVTLEMLSIRTQMDGVTPDGVSRRIAVSAVDAEPQDNFFQIPNPAVEMSPSDYEAATWGPPASNKGLDPTIRNKAWSDELAIRKQKGLTLSRLRLPSTIAPRTRAGGD